MFKNLIETFYISKTYNFLFERLSYKVSSILVPTGTDFSKCKEKVEFTIRVLYLNLELCKDKSNSLIVDLRMKMISIKLR